MPYETSSTSPNIVTIAPLIGQERIEAEERVDAIAAQQSLAPDDLVTATHDLMALIGQQQETKSNGTINRQSNLRGPTFMYQRYVLQEVDHPRNEEASPLNQETFIHFPSGESYQFYLENGKAATAYYHTHAGSEGGRLDQFDGAKASRLFGGVYQEYQDLKSSGVFE